MLLAIDIGNTQTVIGLFKDDTLKHSWRMVTPRHETADEIASDIFSFLKNSGYDPGCNCHSCFLCGSKNIV